MGNPARRFSKARRDSRRAQTFKLGLPGIVECPQCHEMKLAHNVCKNCLRLISKKINPTISMNLNNSHLSLPLKITLFLRDNLGCLILKMIQVAK